MTETGRQSEIKKIISWLKLVTAGCVLVSFVYMIPQIVGHYTRQFWVSIGTILPLWGVALVAWIIIQLLGYFTPKRTVSMRKILLETVLGFVFVGILLFALNGFIQSAAYGTTTGTPEATASPGPTELAAMPYESSFTLPEDGVDFLLVKGVKRGQQVSISISTTGEAFESKVGIAAGLYVYPTYSSVSNNQTNFHNFIGQEDGDHIIRISHGLGLKGSDLNCVVKSSHLIGDTTPNSFSGTIVGDEKILLRIAGVQKGDLLFISTTKITFNWRHNPE
jgi:hypothetical protein